MDIVQRITLPAFAAVMLLCSHVHAASVWRVSSDQHSLYIGGTIHILAPEDYPLPKEYDQAFALASTIVFETDMNAVSQPQFRQKMLASMSYPAGKSLGDDLSADVYAALDAHLTKRGMAIGQLASLKPSLVAITLSMLELRALGFTSIGVDQYYANLAGEKGKKQGWLETPAQQLSFLANLGQGEEDALIEYSLRDIANMPKMIGELRTSWRAGDIESITEVSIVPFKADYPQIYQDLLVSRNNNWIPKIELMLADAPIELILVGLLHLAGADSVLTQLTAKGYTVEKI